MSAGGFDRVPSRSIDLANDRYEITQGLSKENIDLWIENETSVPEHLRNLALSSRQREPAHGDGANERVTDGAHFRDSRIQAQIRALEHADPNDIAGNQ